MIKVAAFRHDAIATVKTSSPLPDCRVNYSLVKFVPFIDTNALKHLANVFDSTLLYTFSVINDHIVQSTIYLTPDCSMAVGAA